MTLKEIAKMAGVSASTVSRVLNHRNTGAASEEVRNRIWQIIRRSGYMPNRAARDLKTGTLQENASKNIACIFGRTKNPATDPFFSRLAYYAEHAAYGMGFIVRFRYAAPDIDDPKVIKTMAAQPVEGVMVLGRCKPRLLEKLGGHFQNIVYCALNPVSANCDQIICDGLKASETAVEHLVALGHRHIGYIGETEVETRYSGYLNVLKAHRFTYGPKYTSRVLQSYEGGESGAMELLKAHPQITAVFCANDITATGAVAALKELGLKVPGDISVIGIDDIDMPRASGVALTTVHIPLEELGAMTAKILIDRIKGGHSLPLTLQVPFMLIRRESCAKLIQN